MSRSSGGALTSDLPTFSLSPQEYMTKVCKLLSQNVSYIISYIWIGHMQDNISAKSKFPRTVFREKVIVFFYTIVLG